MKGVITEPEVLDDGRCSPAPSIKSVRLSDALSGKVMKVMLHQLVQVVAEEDLELVLELVVSPSLDLSDGARGEDLGGGLPDDPGAVIIPRHNTD